MADEQEKQKKQHPEWLSEDGKPLENVLGELEAAEAPAEETVTAGSGTTPDRSNASLRDLVELHDWANKTNRDKVQRVEDALKSKLDKKTYNAMTNPETLDPASNDIGNMHVNDRRKFLVKKDGKLHLRLIDRESGFEKNIPLSQMDVAKHYRNDSKAKDVDVFTFSWNNQSVTILEQPEETVFKYMRKEKDRQPASYHASVNKKGQKKDAIQLTAKPDGKLDFTEPYANQTAGRTTKATKNQPEPKNTPDVASSSSSPLGVAAKSVLEFAMHGEEARKKIKMNSIGDTQAWREGTEQGAVSDYDDIKDSAKKRTDLVGNLVAKGVDKLANSYRYTLLAGAGLALVGAPVMAATAGVLAMGSLATKATRIVNDVRVAGSESDPVGIVKEHFKLEEKVGKGAGVAIAATGAGIAAAKLLMVTGAVVSGPVIALAAVGAVGLGGAGFVGMQVKKGLESWVDSVRPQASPETSKSR